MQKRVIIFPKCCKLHSELRCDTGSVVNNGRFYTRDAFIRLDELGQAFVVRLVMFPQYKDGHKTHYASRRTMFDSSS